MVVGVARLFMVRSSSTDSDGSNIIGIQTITIVQCIKKFVEMANSLELMLPRMLFSHKRVQ